MKLLAFIAAFALLGVSTPSQGQSLIKGYSAKAKNVAKGVRQKPRTRASKYRKSANQRLVARAKAGLHGSEQVVVRSLGGGLKAVYVRSQLLPKQYDRFRLFKVAKSGRATELKTKKLYKQMVRGLSYEQLVDLWTKTVAVVRTRAYERKPDVRILVDEELRFLEKRIDARARRSPSYKLPWKKQLVDPVRELDKIGNGKRLVSQLKAGNKAARGSVEMLKRGAITVSSPQTVTREFFDTMVKTAKQDKLTSLYGIEPTEKNWRAFRRKGSKVAKALSKQVYGLQIGRHRETLILPHSFKDRFVTLIHELNHGANRIPTKKKFTQRETLAFEHSAHAAEGARTSAKKLKNGIIRDYELAAVKASDVADKPGGVMDNWVPHFPKGQEKAYINAYYRVR